MPERSQSSNNRLGKQSRSVPTRRPLAIWIWSTLLIADAVLVARRVSGEMALSPPPILALLSMAVVALASAQLVASVWCAANPNLNMRERPPQYQTEMLKFVDMVRMTIDAITSTDD